ncbi:hypothetical protein CGLO_11133 [Colletotrichum gloeosporioides Cg-14]|uniref:Uncharacterized protein n=1 Tax=Colletotrichum gloeosporioides (strain Cg-14) TaxID=1237896 RepID=T0LCV3_COLGC|nr:hypothetical protein CGLO_11133 [Colletotrichum gloeosporioides Cg-14]
MWDAAFRYETAEALDPGVLEIIYSDEYVAAFQSHDKTTIAQLGMPFESLMGMSEAAEAQARAAKTIAPKLITTQEGRRQEYRTAMESGVCGLAPCQTHEKLEHGLILLEINTSTIVASFHEPYRNLDALDDQAFTLSWSLHPVLVTQSVHDFENDIGRDWDAKTWASRNVQYDGHDSW